MAKKSKPAGKRVLQFTLFGARWDVREVPAGHKCLCDGALDGWGEVHFEDNRIYIRNEKYATREQRVTALMHEVQHVIEEHYCIDLAKETDHNGSESRTDHIALGWLYVVRGCPEILQFVQNSDE